MSVDKVDNQTIECMVCASCTFKGEKRQEERKIDRSEGEAGGRSQRDVEEEKLNCRKIVKTVLEKTAGMRRRWTMRLREDVAGSFIGNCAGRDKDLCTKC